MMTSYKHSFIILISLISLLIATKIDIDELSTNKRDFERIKSNFRVIVI